MESQEFYGATVTVFVVIFLFIPILSSFVFASGYRTVINLAKDCFSDSPVPNHTNRLLQFNQ